MEFKLLGPLEVLEGDQVVPVGGAKQRALLALLLLHANAVISRDRLIDELWGDRAAGSAEHSLDHQVSRLRKLLIPPKVLVTRSGGYVLEVDPERIDIHVFERLLDEARRDNADGRPNDAEKTLRRALALWRGPALADFAYEAFARIEIERLEELHLAAIEERIDADLALGRHHALAAELESLTALHPLRERLRGQQMLALHRSGRQADALRVYSDTRRRLVEEAGIEPGRPLRELEQAILRQDATLEAAPIAGIAPTGRKLRGSLAAAAALALAAGAAAIGVLLAHGGTEGSRAQALVAPDEVALVSGRTGKVLGEARAVQAPLLSRFGAGALWNVSYTGQLTKIDPVTGDVIATLNTGVPIPCGLAVGEGSVWVTDCTSPTLVQIDPALAVRTARIALPAEADLSGTDTGDVAVGAGSVWVARGFANPSWLDRLDPRTGRVVEHVLIARGGAQRLTLGDGALWVAGDVDALGVPKLWRIDARTSEVTPLLGSFPRAFSSIAVGGGFVWGATPADHKIWKVAEDGTPVTEITLRADAQNLSYADGALWAADGEAGAVVRVEPTTGRKRAYTLGHDLQGVAVRNGVVAISVQPSGRDITAGLKGRIVRVALASDALDWGSSGTDPAGTIMAFDQWQVQYQYATCAKLLDYRDAPGASGKTLVPEVARAWPLVTDDGLTYTFRIRRGYGFSPPSRELVTAASFRRALERVVRRTGSSSDLFSGIAGADAYRLGAADLSGVSAKGDTLVIHLTKPVPELPSLLALPFACAVPATLPLVGLPYPIPTAGPYYVADRSRNVVVLKTNPNYHGPRVRRLDAIVYAFNVDIGAAVRGIEEGKLDYIEEPDPVLAAGTAAARAAGSRYRVTPNDWTEGLALNPYRPLFSHARLRRAVAYAVDRSELAANVGSIPTSHVLPPRFAGFDEGPRYPLRPDLSTAQKLAGSRPRRAVYAMQTDDSGVPYPEESALLRALRKELAGIGMTLQLRTWRQSADPAHVASVLASADLVHLGTNGDDAIDPVLLFHRSRAYQYLTPAERKSLARVATFSPPRRETAAAGFAAQLERDAVFIGIGDRVTPELVSKRLGCVIEQPEYPGLDLAALCLRKAHA